MVLWKNGLHLDWPQLRLQGSSISGIRLGLVLAIFSFVGFESATALGHEAKEPLRTIPRAVLQCALGAGAFFILAAYAEVLGFRGTGLAFDKTDAPDARARQPELRCPCLASSSMPARGEHVRLCPGLHHGRQHVSCC